MQVARLNRSGSIVHCRPCVRAVAVRRRPRDRWLLHSRCCVSAIGRCGAIGGDSAVFDNCEAGEGSRCRQLGGTLSLEPHASGVGH